MINRRRIIQLVPATLGAAALTACGKKEEAPAPAPVAAAPAPAPAPAAAPAPAPAAAPTDSNASTLPAPSAPTATGGMVDEKSPQAQSLGYVADASNVDKAKFASFKEGSNCAGCALYSAAGAESGGCSIFPGQKVSAKGWCSAWAKKA